MHTPHAYYYLGKTGVARFALLAAEAPAVAAVSHPCADDLPSETARAVHDLHIPARRVTTCTNAVEISAVAQPRELAGAPPRVALVGRVSPQKNLPMYLRVVARLQQDPRITARLSVRRPWSLRG